MFGLVGIFGLNTQILKVRRKTLQDRFGLRDIHTAGFAPWFHPACFNNWPCSWLTWHRGCDSGVSVKRDGRGKNKQKKMQSLQVPVTLLTEDFNTVLGKIWSSSGKGYEQAVATQWLQWGTMTRLLFMTQQLQCGIFTSRKHTIWRDHS